MPVAEALRIATYPTIPEKTPKVSIVKTSSHAR
jgi:hypothetical protein